MNEKNLRDHLRSHYGSKAPPAELVAKLEEMARTGAPAPARPRRRLVLAMAALALLGVLGLAGSRLGTPPATPPGPELMHFAREIAAHHTHCKTDTLVAAADFAEAAERLDRLDFQLVEPGRLQDDGLAIEGVRQCLLRDHLMAELRVRCGDGKKGTLCISRLPASISSAEEGVIEVDGLRVRIWSEAGLLVGLAVPA